MAKTKKVKNSDDQGKSPIRQSSILQQIKNNFGLCIQCGGDTIEFQVRVGGPSKLQYYDI